MLLLACSVDSLHSYVITAEAAQHCNLSLSLSVFRPGTDLHVDCRFVWLEQKSAGSGRGEQLKATDSHVLECTAPHTCSGSLYMICLYSELMYIFKV